MIAVVRDAAIALVVVARDAVVSGQEAIAQELCTAHKILSQEEEVILVQLTPQLRYTSNLEHEDENEAGRKQEEQE